MSKQFGIDMDIAQLEKCIEKPPADDEPIFIAAYRRSKSQGYIPQVAFHKACEVFYETEIPLLEARLAGLKDGLTHSKHAIEDAVDEPTSCPCETCGGELEKRLLIANGIEAKEAKAVTLRRQLADAEYDIHDLHQTARNLRLGLRSWPVPRRPGNVERAS